MSASAGDRNGGAQAQRWELPEFDAPGGGASAQPKAKARPAEELHTAADLDALQKSAYDEGFAEGLKDGLEAGREQIAEQAQRLAQMIDAVAAPLAEIDVDVERTLVNLALTLARRIVVKAVANDDDALLALVDKVINELGETDEPLNVHVSAVDFDRLQAHLEQHPNWRLLADDTLEPGDIRVATSTSEIDARLRQRFERMAETMLDGL